MNQEVDLPPTHAPLRWAATRTMSIAGSLIFSLSMDMAHDVQEQEDSPPSLIGTSPPVEGNDSTLGYASSLPMKFIDIEHDGICESPLAGPKSEPGNPQLETSATRFAVGDAQYRG